MPETDLSKLRIEKLDVRSGGTRKSKRKVILLGLAGLCAVLAALYAAGPLRPATQVDVANVVQVFPSQALTLLNASGYVVPQRKAAVASKITGRLLDLLVEEGSRVKKGQLIARLESDDLAAQRTQAAANLDVTKANLEQSRAELKEASAAYDREKNLLRQEFTTRAAYDAAEARYNKAVAAVAAAESSVKASAAALRNADVSIEYSQIRAPFDAVVLTKNADIGDLVTPVSGAASAKAAVVTIADMDSLQVEADVSESNIKQVAVGQPCEIQLDAIPDVRFRGVIHMIVPTADRSKASVMVKVRFLRKDSRILPEMSAKVAFLSRDVSAEEERPRTGMNPKAVAERNGRKFAFVVKEGRALETAITTGPPIGDFLEVTEGVKAGDRVVVSPPRTLVSGARIKVREN